MGSTGKSTNYWTVVKPDGTVVRLPAELVYSEDTGSVEIPKQVLDFEAKYRSSDIEHLILYNNMFGVIGEHTGDEGHVEASLYEHSMADITSHNHPRAGEDEKGWISGTFSDADISSFADVKGRKTDRVTASEGVYSISKGANFDRGLVDAYKAHNDSLRQSSVPLVQDIQRRIEADYKKLKNDFNAKSANMSYEEYNKAYEGFKKDWNAINTKYRKETDDLANKFAISSHNWLLENQKKYGYTYGLTRG